MKVTKKGNCNDGKNRRNEHKAAASASPMEEEKKV